MRQILSARLKELAGVPIVSKAGTEKTYITRNHLSYR
jgi:hypothetical protein